jgi:hypothetical protein
MAIIIKLAAMIERKYKARIISAGNQAIITQGEH